jgi:hypothetical protein
MTGMSIHALAPYKDVEIKAQTVREMKFFIVGEITKFLL